MAKARKQAKSKARRQVWFRKVRGSYLPVSSEGWLMHTLLVFSVIAVLIIATGDERDFQTVAITTVLQLLGVGVLFSYIASRQS